MSCLLKKVEQLRQIHLNILSCAQLSLQICCFKEKLTKNYENSFKKKSSTNFKEMLIEAQMICVLVLYFV